MKNGEDVDMLKIGYFADGPWAHRTFERIIKDDTIKICFICVRYDSTDDELVRLARLNGIDLIKHPNINSDEFYTTVQQYEANLFVSMSFNQIFKERIMNLPPLTTINCHAGKLPFYRGRNILNWVLINDEKEFGITVHYMDKGIDTGDIVLQRTFSITDEDNYATLLERAYSGCADILYDAIKQIQYGISSRTKQSTIAEIGMYCGKRKVGDEVINWNQSSRRVFNFVRALCDPGPQARCFCGSDEVCINRVKMVEEAPTYIGIPGQILGSENGGLIVKTEDTYVEVVDYSCSRKLRIGDRLTSCQSEKTSE